LNTGVSVGLLLIVALLAANAPFVFKRRFFVWAMPHGQVKGLAWHWLELVLMYFAVGGLGLLLEQSLGQIAPQRWEFYAITACMFITMAFPGFVWRFLLKAK
jgi:uncharacterized membrane protein